MIALRIKERTSTLLHLYAEVATTVPPSWSVAQARALAHRIAAELILARGAAVEVQVDPSPCGARITVASDDGESADALRALCDHASKIGKLIASTPGTSWLPSERRRGPIPKLNQGLVK